MKHKRLILTIWSAMAAMGLSSMGSVSANVGTEQWRVLENSGVNGGNDQQDYGYDVAFDSQGNLISVGLMDSPQTGTTTNDNAYIVKYDSTGTKLWEHQYDDGNVQGTNCNTQKCDSSDALYDVVVDAADNILVGGKWSGNYPTDLYHQAHWVRSISADGNTTNWEHVWHQGAWNACYDLAQSDAGDTYTAGTSFVGWGSNRGDWVMFHYDSDGVPDSNYPYFHNVSPYEWLPDRAYGTAVDSDGYHYAVGMIGISGTSGGSSNNFNWHVRKIDPADGTLIWSDTLDGNSLYDVARKIIVDGNNDVYVAGYLNMGTDNTADHADYDWVVVKYAGAGDGANGAVKLWTHTFTGPTGKNASAQNLAWDSATDTIIVVGPVINETTDLNEIRLERLDPATGNIIREQTISSANDVIPVGIAIQGDKLALAGYQQNGSDWDVMTVMLNAIRAGLSFDPATGLSTTEAGGTATVDIKLASAPTQEVTVSLTSSNTAEGTISPASLTFTPANWDTAQTVTITGVEDSVDDGDQDFNIQFSVTSSDLLYDGLAVADLTVTNRDNDPIFADVPIGYWAYDWIQSLVDSGITSGCGTDTYCPSSDVSRAQMAVFLERGIHGSDYAPPAATGTVFDDVPADYWAASWIESLNTDGITGGCGGGNYCPDSQVDRAQMAVFLLRSEHGSDYTPPAATGTMFDDIPADYWAASWIEQLATEGITSGCDANNYCPDDPVQRDSMAVFLTRTFNL
ncbi:S-layer homology domain-containing protein [Thiolapillus brandeum]|uniref:SLH domain-containing protein n=1 Tax=Thiolapillus brandeum TaxID=1076588 RepID=A0A7U6JIM1_9GAMM|nr:S-layer homology domain-containing protein [Thiolapillus brandeum]BAO44948.1 hypothetical protein TBH_C2034 [Thiolapillus brandeum]